MLLSLTSFAVPKCAGTLKTSKSAWHKERHNIRLTMVNRTAKRNPPGVKIDVRLRYTKHEAIAFGPKTHEVLCQTDSVSPKKGKNAISMVVSMPWGGSTDGVEPQFRESGHKTWYSCPDQVRIGREKTVTKLVRFWEFSNNRHVACSMH